MRSKKKNQNSFLGNIFVHIQAKYRMTTKGLYSIRKKSDRRTDRRAIDCSTSDKLRRLFSAAELKSELWFIQFIKNYSKWLVKFSLHANAKLLISHVQCNICETFYKYGFILILVCTNNYIHYKVRDKYLIYS